jgi:AcrR family transcriptional regulator
MQPDGRKVRAQRPTRADGAATRRRILECAGRLFAATGYAETTSKAIAAAAGVDLASINYHYRSRQGLYRAVLVEAHRQLIRLELLHRLDRAQVSPDLKLRWLIEALVEGALTRQKWQARVLAREMMAPSSNLKALAEQEALPKLQGIARVIGEVIGVPAQHPAVSRCLLNIAAPCLMLFVAPSGVRGPAQQMLEMPKADVVAHLYRFASAGLAAIAEDCRPMRRRGRTAPRS